MKAYANQIAASLRSRGHRVQARTAPAVLGRLLFRKAVAMKWLG
jgi:hypothetical protein